VFHRDNWAAAFISVSGENADAGLACLRAMTPPVQAVKGALFGRSAAKQLEKILRESAISPAVSPAAGRAAGGADRPDIAAEYAIRFISLLIEKNLFRYIDLILEKIEARLDEQKGILDVTAESAAPMDSVFEEYLRQMIRERTGAAGIKMKTRLAPELLGGYRLRISGLCIDASLKGQLDTMTADLAAPDR
jgi:F0F1-type ATP synthase delta subunit